MNRHSRIRTCRETDGKTSDHAGKSENKQGAGKKRFLPGPFLTKSCSMAITANNGTIVRNIMLRIGSSSGGSNMVAGDNIKMKTESRRNNGSEIKASFSIGEYFLVES